MGPSASATKSPASSSARAAPALAPAAILVLFCCCSTVSSVPLTSADAVRRVVPRADSFRDIRSEDGQSTAYVFADLGAGRTLARFFFPAGDVMLEDPATGSATANYGGWCIATRQTLPLAIEISQGAQIGRPSTLYLDIDSSGCIRVGGEVIELARGVVNL